VPTLSDAWDQEAEAWVRWARQPGHDSYWLFHRDAFLSIVPPAGRLTLDVGCGEGRLARDLAGLGHRVVALDRSPTMARYAHAGGGVIGTVVGDGARLPYPDEIADLAVAFMSIHDMDDMTGCVREMARVLEPSGRLCMAVVHPINSGRTVGETASADRWTLEENAYFETRRVTDTVERDGLRMTFNSTHRPLESYFSALEAAGLLTEAVREPRGTGSASTRFPFFLHIRARKP
jgi:SAM-dependent methyltransferase